MKFKSLAKVSSFFLLSSISKSMLSRVAYFDSSLDKRSLNLSCILSMMLICIWKLLPKFPSSLSPFSSTLSKNYGYFSVIGLIFSVNSISKSSNSASTALSFSRISFITLYFLLLSLFLISSTLLLLA
jgi:hypothetical protein